MLDSMDTLVRFSYTVILGLFLCSLCWSQRKDGPAPNDKNVQQYLETLKKGTICDRRAAIIALHHMGKSVVPMLIDHIADRDVAPSSTLMLANPLLSYAPAGSQRNEFSGVIYAYVVELILAREALHDDKDCTFLLSTGDYAYGHGLIMKGNNVIPATDLSKVKQQYSRWWEENRNKDLSTLRSEWKKSFRPLTGSGYNWM